MSNLEVQKEFNYPESVIQFLTRFYEAYKRKNKKELQRIYDLEFRKVSEEHFKNRSWPVPETLSYILPSDDLFDCLYRELYYRHLYLRLEPKSIDRRNSFKSYFFLFKKLTEQSDISFIPGDWLWDMLDEFVYQFQWCWSRSEKFTNTNVPSSTETVTEPQASVGNTQFPAWSLHSMFSVLRNLILVSGVCLSIYSPRHLMDTDDPTSSTTTGSSSSTSSYINTVSTDALYRLGFFALVSILRVHVICGDFYHAHNTISVILEKMKKGSVSDHFVPACMITFCRYAGYTCHLVKRYSLSQSLLSRGILTFWRNRGVFHVGTYHYELASRRYEQMLANLVVLYCTQSKKIEESVFRLMQERHSDRFKKLLTRDVNALRELYQIFTPKIISAGIFLVPQQRRADLKSGAIKIEMKSFQNHHLFAEERQLYWPSIRSMLLTQKRIPIEKLSDCYKKPIEFIRGVIETQIFHNNCSPILTEKSLLKKSLTDQWMVNQSLMFESYTIGSNADESFVIDLDVAIYRDASSGTDFRMMFLREISRMKQLNCDLRIRKLTLSHLESSSNFKSVESMQLKS